MGLARFRENAESDLLMPNPTLLGRVLVSSFQRVATTAEDSGTSIAGGDVVDRPVRAREIGKLIRSHKGVSPRIPESCYVDPSAEVIGDVVLGEHASVWMNAVLRGDVHAIRVGAYSNIQDCCVLHGMKERYPVLIGEYVTVGHSVTLHGCEIGGCCLIGMGSIILNGARIGSGSIIAAGTLVPERAVVEPDSLWMGSPGTFRRKLEEHDRESILRYARNYLEYKDSYLREQ